MRRQLPPAAQPGLADPDRLPAHSLAAGACYLATNLLLSLRFLTSQSQTLASLNAFKPLLALVVVAGLAALVSGVRRPPPWVRRALASPWLAAALLVAFAAANFHLYPLLDREAVKLAGEGSDADDALIDAASRLLRGEAPYAAPTYRGNPISPGLGWVALNALWANTAWFFAMTPLYLAALAGLVRWVCGSWPAANLVVIGHLGCLGFWELAPTHDLGAFGLALAGGFVAAFALRRSAPALTAIAVVLGVIASARVPFAAFPLLTAALLARAMPLWPLLAGLGTGVAAALPLAHTYLDLGPYQPFHLADAGAALLPGAWLAGAAAATLTVALLVLRRPAGTLADLTLRAWACLVVPLGFVAAAQLAAIGFDTGRWEGANYLMPAFSFAVVSLALAGRPADIRMAAASQPPSPASSQI
jgi:hypothetical protein